MVWGIGLTFGDLDPEGHTDLLCGDTLDMAKLWDRRTTKCDVFELWSAH